MIPKDTQPFKAVLRGDLKALAASGEKGLLQILKATHTGMTTEVFSEIAAHWLATARHPRFKRPYNQLVYQPMLELLAYLRTDGFKTFIASGGVEFMRVFAEQTYGVLPEQVIGSSGVTRFEMGAGGKPVLVKEAKSSSSTTGQASRSGSTGFIGRRPIFAFGNSDGDLQMLQWTAAGRAPGSWASSITPMPSANLPTTGSQSHVGRLDEVNRHCLIYPRLCLCYELLRLCLRLITSH